MRAFIAIDLSPAVLQNLEKTVHALQPSLPRQAVRWVAVKNIHLTLKFLGELETRHVEAVQEIMRIAAQRQPCFDIQMGELGAFPSFSRPRVIWVGVQAPPHLAALQAEIDAQVSRLGYLGEERSFTPHLTLGRVNRQVSFDEVRKIGEALRSFPLASLGVTRAQAVHLYRSDLRPSGPIYARLYSAALQPVDQPITQ